MVSESFDQRFGGIRRLYGVEATELLRRIHVCVVGVGGVGSWAAEALARSAVGEITLIDLDDICVTNTNRQIHAMANTIGQNKTDVMAERIRQINPECVVHIVDDFVTSENVGHLINQRFDYVLDAIDNFRAKAALIAHCKRSKIKIITTGGVGGQIDPLKIQVVDLTKTIHDPLSRKVKKQLRRVHHFSKNPKRRFAVECVSSTEAARYLQPDGSVCQTKPDFVGSMKMDCASGFGASTVVTATLGFVAVSRIIEKLTTVGVRRINDNDGLSVESLSQ
ncbi:MAG: tRNA cyclic N6-threonylcarbamoyladenosine(37) synthase TcdA [Endozoicomonadaceae bacterium]|nr:tRNA cyclic N6-threonylcarbamoyladenosine(37) synthase TcdA [Endozoicomonadaceae bacterium]